MLSLCSSLLFRTANKNNQQKKAIVVFVGFSRQRKLATKRMSSSLAHNRISSINTLKPSSSSSSSSSSIVRFRSSCSSTGTSTPWAIDQNYCTKILIERRMSSVRGFTAKAATSSFRTRAAAAPFSTSSSNEDDEDEEENDILAATKTLISNEVWGADWPEYVQFLALLQSQGYAQPSLEYEPKKFPSSSSSSSSTTSSMSKNSNVPA